MNCNTTHYRANSSSVPGDPTEPHCFKSRHRVPRVGELSNTIRDDIWAQQVADAWGHPGAGKLWDGTRWRDVPGHKASWYADQGVDEWPRVDGIPLNQWPTDARLDALERLVAS